MEELNSMLEKISTLNINANTDVDIQGIVDTYMFLNAAKHVGVALITSVTILITVWLIYKFVTKLGEDTKKAKVVKRMEEILDSFGNWDEIRALNKKVDEVREYMPRNKRKRKLD